MEEIPFSSEEELSLSLVRYSAPATDSHHEPSPGYVATTHEMHQQQLSSPYDSSMPPPSLPPPPRTRKRARSGSVDDDERNLNRNIGMQQSFPGLSHDGSVALRDPPDFLYPGNSYYALPHPGSVHGFPPRMALPAPPQQHHHHYLPSQASIPLDSHGVRRASSSGNPGHISVVKEPGMPEPSPEPTRIRALFTPKDDEKIIYLKEVKRLSWPQIEDFFPGRNKNTIQVRYCEHLKDRDVEWTDQRIQRLRDAIDEHNASLWKFVARKLGRKITANVCRKKAIELGWATPRPGEEFMVQKGPATSNTPILREPDTSKELPKSGPRGGRGRGRGKEKVNQSG